MFRSPILCALLLFLLTAGVVIPARQGRAATPDYSHAPGFHQLLHWTHFPVRVCFTPGGADTAAREKSARAGFDEWVQAAQGVVSYQVVETPAQADITVGFLPGTYLPGQPGTVGFTDFTFSGSVLRRAAMTLATGDATGEDLQAIAAHEFGHALGLDGHSDDPDDLMYPSSVRLFSSEGGRLPTPPRHVTARDLNTLKACYRSLFDLAQQHEMGHTEGA